MGSWTAQRFEGVEKFKEKSNVNTFLTQVHPQARIVHKGGNPNVDSYSAFFDNAKLGKTTLDETLKAEEVGDVYVCGIATDVCVASTAHHANELGFRTILIDNCRLDLFSSFSLKIVLFYWSVGLRCLIGETQFWRTA